jgi:hypothetical protein
LTQSLVLSYCPTRYAPPAHRPGRSLPPRCGSGRSGRARRLAGVARSLPRPADPLPPGEPARCLPARLQPAGVMVAGSAGSAAGLSAGRGRIDPRPVRYHDRLDVPPPWHRAGACGLAGAVARHRGVWRQPGGVPRRRSALRAAMVGQPKHRSGHEPWLRRARRGDRIAVAASGCCECSAAGAARHASRSRARKVACVMVDRISAAHFCPCWPRSIDRAATLPGTANIVMSDTRGRSMASPVVLIRAARNSSARPGTALAFRSFDPLSFLPRHECHRPPAGRAAWQTELSVGPRSITHRGRNEPGSRRKRAPVRPGSPGVSLPCPPPYFIAFCKFSSSFARKACVFIHGASGAISTDRSRVMFPASTVSTHTFSSVSANFVTSGVSSNRPR